MAEVVFIMLGCWVFCFIGFICLGFIALETDIPLVPIYVLAAVLIVGMVVIVGLCICGALADMIYQTCWTSFGVRR